MRTRPARVLAVDLGATSVRVASVDLDAQRLEPRIVHRWRHEPLRHGDGTLRWDWDCMVGEVERGLEAGMSPGPVASIGIDAWGVDYGLLDGSGKLLSPPLSYRDSRTRGWQQTLERLGPERLYGITGIQSMAINTVFQLAAHDPAELERARHLLMLPELVVHALCGAVTGERTSAGTTALVDVSTGTWSRPLLDDIGVDEAIMPEIRDPGTLVGRWRGIPVHLVGGHDTASAVVALPAPPDLATVFVASGTWVLVGAERSEADLSEEARRGNFSNEAGTFGGVRLLKNLTGFWLLEQCRRGWGDASVELLLAEARAVHGVPTVDPSDERFLAPEDMEAEIRSAAGLPASAPRGAVTRCILESIAAGVARTVALLDARLPAPAVQVAVIGGGARVELLNALIAEHTGLPLIAGSPEATALGNALTQGVALGRFAGLADARTHLLEVTAQ